MTRLFAALVCFVWLLPGHEALCQNARGHEDIVRFYFQEVVNKQQLERLHQVFADTIVVHNLVEGSTEIKSIEEQKDFLVYLFRAFPDIHYTIGDIITEEDTTAVRVTLTATHKGEFWGYAASGNKIDYLSEVFFLRFEHGKVVESWTQFDLHSLFKSLGAK